MSVNPSAFGPKPQFELSNGTPAVGNKLFFYVGGSVGTKATTYTDSAGTVPNTNPVILDSLGMPTNQIWWTAGQTYKVVYAPSTDTDPPTSPIFTVDGLLGNNDTTSSQTEWISGPTPTFVSATSFTLVGDQTSTFHIGRRLKTTNTAGTIYSTITNSAFAVATTITVVNDSGVLDSGLSAVSYGLLSSTNGSAPWPKGAFNFAGVLSPSQITASQNDYSPTGLPVTNQLRLSTSARWNMTGLAGGTNGRHMTVHNVGTFPLVFTFNDTASVAANRFAFGLTLGGGQSCELEYDSTSALWRCKAKPEPLGTIKDFGGATLPADFLAIDQNVSRTTYAALFNEIGTTWGTGDGSSTFGLFVGAGRTRIASGTGTVTESVAAASVSTASDNFTVTANNTKWITGQPVVLTTTGTLPTGLSLATTYFLVRSSSTLIQFSTTLANAQNGTVIDLTTQGTGTHTVTGTMTARTLGEQGGEEAHAQSLTEMLAHTHALTWPSTFYHGNWNTLNNDTGTGAAGSFYTPPATANSRGGNVAMNVMQPFAVVTVGIRYS